MLSVIIPASNEEGWIGPCLEALLAQDIEPERAGGVEVIVAANACRDATVAIATGFTPRFADRGIRLTVLDIAGPGKRNALNVADASAQGDMRAYLDADVTLSPPLLAEVAALLARPEPAWASGRLTVARAASPVTRAYARLWARLPFMTAGVPGAGFFAVNAAGRARWGAFPDIISDDGYVRLLFTPAERHGAAAAYLWPMAEGFSRLVRVRRRQDAGNREIEARFPALTANEGKPRLGAMGFLRLALRDPPGMAVYCAVSLAVRAGGTRDFGTWTRGR